MTTTLYVKARAHGAIITVKNLDTTNPDLSQSNETKLNAWEEREIHIDDNQELTVKQGTPELIQELNQDKQDQLEATSGNDTLASGAGNDTIFAGTDGDAVSTFGDGVGSVLGGQGNDVIEETSADTRKKRP